MSAMFAGGWSGMGLIDDLDRGVMDRFLVAPTSRGAIMLGRVTPQVLTILIQTLIIVGLALLVGGRFGGGVAGAVMLIVVSTLLSIGVASLSNGVALLLRKEESVIAAVNMVLLPLIFLSSAFLQQSLAPQWIQDIARYNPANWAIEAGRTALASGLRRARCGRTRSTWRSSRSSARSLPRAPFAPTSARSERRVATHVRVSAGSRGTRGPPLFPGNGARRVRSAGCRVSPQASGGTAVCGMKAFGS